MHQSTDGGVVALLVGHWTCNLQVAGSSPGQAVSRTGLGQVTYTGVAMSASSIIWYRPKSSYIVRLGT